MSRPARHAINIDLPTYTLFQHLAKTGWMKPVIMFPEQFDVILDVGAFCGTFSTFARVFNNKAEIVAIEPCDDIMKLLKTNVEKMNITTHRLALNDGRRGVMSSEKASVSNIFVAKDGPNACDSMTLFDMVTKLTTWKEGKSLLVKMNCEGGEAFVFNHEPSLNILSLADVALIECHGRKNKIRMVELINDRFSATHIAKKLSTKISYRADYSFINKKLMEKFLSENCLVGK